MFDKSLTNSLESERIFHSIIMQEEQVTVRDVLRNFRSFIKKKKSLIVTNHGKPEVVIVPYEQWKKTEKTEKKRKGLMLLDIVDKYAFKGGDPDLSQKIDEIVYGAANPYRDDSD